MKDKTCFFCSQTITEHRAYIRFWVKDLSRSYDLHQDCMREILGSFVIETLQREADLERRSREKETVEVMALRLSFQEQCARCGGQGGYHFHGCQEIS